jgi:hypothetical protein
MPGRDFLFSFSAQHRRCVRGNQKGKSEHADHGDSLRSRCFRLRNSMDMENGVWVVAPGRATLTYILTLVTVPLIWGEPDCRMARRRYNRYSSLISEGL